MKADERRLPADGVGAKPAHASPVDALLGPEAILGFLMFGLALALVLAAGAGPGRGDLGFLGLTALLIQWVIALSLGCLHLLRRPLRALPLGWLVAVLAGIVIAIALASGFTGWVLLSGPEARPSDLAEFLLRIVLVAAAMAVAGGLVAVNAARWQKSKTELARAELKHLQARVRPHFLFNTLNTATALLPHRAREAESVLLDLADLFRVALREAQVHSLSAELEMARQYLHIEETRLQQRLAVRWDVPGQLPPIEVPTFSIQALVENAIHHGIEPSDSGGSVAVECTLDDGKVKVTVSNTLPARTGQTRRLGGEHLGLSSTRARLAVHMGPEARLVTEVRGSDFVAELTLPAQATTR